MTISALIIRPDDTHEIREIEPTGDAIRDILGGWLEGVSPSLDTDWMAYADEEGRLKQLPVNPVATLLARQNGWPGDYLVGPVVFVGMEWVGGETGYREVDVPERLVEATA